MKPSEKLYHIMFLPVFGTLDHDFLLNIATIIVFLVIYFWHLKHDHTHNKELLDEVRKIREEIRKK